MLNFVHCDICGPLQTRTTSSAWYFLLFVDDLSRKQWVYFLKKKSVAFSKFKVLKEAIEKGFGRCVKVLCSNNGEEICSNELFDFFVRRKDLKCSFCT